MAVVRLLAIFSVAYSLIIVTKGQAPVDNEPKLAVQVIGDVGGVAHHQESGQHSVGGSQHPGSGSDCIDRTGKRVPVGSIYHPYNHSPCTICECLEDKLMMSCSSTGCDALKCLNFVVDPDSCCGYTCIDNKTAASLDVRQVGADKIIVQWEMNKEYSNYTITGMKLLYSIGYGELKNWTDILVAPGEQSAVVSGLQHGVVYTFKGVGHVDHEVYPVEIPIKPAQIVLERRNGNYLKLEKQLHQKNVVIRANGNIYGEVELEDKMYINLSLFKLVKEGKTQLLGKWYRTIKLYNMQDGMKSPIDNKGDLDISVRDMKEISRQRPEKMMTDVVDKEREEKKFMTEFLMLPCTAIGQTTSSSIAEKSNIWAEQRLLQKKCELDKKLYKNMIKLNSDMLGLNDELAKMRKSASSSSLDSFNSKSQRCGFSSGPNSPKIRPKGRPTSHLASSLKSAPQCRSQNISSKTGSGRTSPECVNGLVKNTSFHLGSESSSEDSEIANNEQENKNKKKTRVKSSSSHGIGRHDNNCTRTISVTSCQTGRDCGANRADLISFQNATKRYNKTLSDHSLNHHK